MRFLTVEEAAAELKVSRRHIDRMIKAGKLKATDIGLGSNHVWRIEIDSVEADLQEPLKRKRRKPVNIERFV